MSMRAKAVAGLIWTFGQQGFSICLNFIVSIILARLLMPAEFGLIGMLAVFIAVGEALMNGGLASSLIRTESPDQIDYSTVFFVNLGGSIIIYLIGYICAPFIANFFHHPVLASLLRVYLLCIILYAFSAVPVAKLTKEMEFKRLFVYRLPATIFGGAVGIALAYFKFGAWSLIALNVSQAAVFNVVLWLALRWYPTFTVDLNRFKEHFKFGSSLVLSSILDRLYANAYNLVIGKFYSATDLGYYTRSSTLVQVPTVNLYDALNKVSYPILSSIQNEKQRLANAYKKMMHQALFIVVPILTLMAICAEPLFRVLLTEKWVQAVPYFRIICLAAVLNTVNGYNLTLVLVKGRSDLFLKLNIIEKLFVTVGIFAAIPFGIYGLLYFQVIASVFIYLVNGYACGKLIDYSVLSQLRGLVHIFLIATIAGCIAYFADGILVRKVTGRFGDFWRIGFDGAVYLIIYLGTFIGLGLEEVKEFYDLLAKPVLEKFFIRETEYVQL